MDLKLRRVSNLKTVYLSPSTQPRNMYYGGKYNEEQIMNLVADDIVDYLKAYEVKVINKKISTTERIKEANAMQVDYYLALHSNAGGGRGCETYYQVGANHSKAVKTKSHSFAGKLNWDFSKITPTNTKDGDRGIKTKRWGVNDYNHELRGVKHPANLIEIEFHDTIAGSKWILANIKLIAKTIAYSIVEILDLELIPEILDLELIPTETVLTGDDFYFVQTGAYRKLSEAEIEAKKVAGFTKSEVGIKLGSKYALKWVKGVK